VTEDIAVKRLSSLGWPSDCLVGYRSAGLGTASMGSDPLRLRLCRWNCCDATYFCL